MRLIKMIDIPDHAARLSKTDANRLTEILNLWPCLVNEVTAEVSLQIGQAVPTEAEERLVRLIDYIDEEQIIDDSEIDVNAAFLKPFTYPEDHGILLDRDEALIEIKQIGLNQQIESCLHRVTALEGELASAKLFLKNLRDQL